LQYNIKSIKSNEPRTQRKSLNNNIYNKLNSNKYSSARENIKVFKEKQDLFENNINNVNSVNNENNTNLRSFKSSR